MAEEKKSTPKFSDEQKEIIKAAHQEWIVDGKTYVTQKGWLDSYECQKELEDPEITAYREKGAKGSFKQDYLAYCELFGIQPHPSLLPPRFSSSYPDFPPKKPEDAEEEVPSDDIYDMEAVTELAVKGWRMDPSSLTAMCLAIKADPTIVSLKLSDVGLTKSQVSQLAEGLRGSSVQSLILEWNTFPDPQEQDDDSSDCYAVLLDGQKVLPFSSLTLRGNKITDKGASAIATALRSNHTVTYLNMYNNYISDVGACQIAVAIRYNSMLSTLSLSNNQVTGETAKAFGKSLTRYTLSVEDMAERKQAEVDLAEAKKAAEEAAKKAKKAKKKGGGEAPPTPGDLPPVEEQEDGTGIGHGNKTISTLNLSCNAIDGDSAMAMGDDLKEYIDEVSKNLEYLLLGRNPLGEDATEYFKEDEFGGISIIL